MTKVLIAGGGIAGLAAALAVARAGGAAIVLEQAEAFEEVGAGIQLGPNGRRALEALGAWELVKDQTVRPRGIRIMRAADGARLGSVPTDETFTARFGGTYQLVHRADLLGGLVAAAGGHDRIELRTGSRVDGFAPRDGRVRVHLDNGETLEGDVLIGADGIRSTVRAGLLADGPPAPAGHTLYRALVDMAQVPAGVDTGHVHLWLHAGGHVVHYPVSGGRKFNIVASVNEPWNGEPPSAPSRGERLARVFAGVAGPLRAVLELPEEWLRWVGGDRKPVQNWGKGAVSLIGDAAHPTLPYLASGAVMALEDAVVLGQCLRTAAAKNVQAALRAYERTRQPRTARIVNSSHKLAGIYHAGQPLAFLRDGFIRFSSGNRALERMAWLYSWRP